LTPLVLLSLLESGEPIPLEVTRRAVDFILEHCDSEGALGRADRHVIDYPIYATALGVRAMIQAGVNHWRPMLDYLRAQQFTEANGWNETDQPYGGWGIGGDRRRPPHAGHVDLSMTRYVLEAFRAAGVPPSDPVFRKARVFIRRCRNADGGFQFSPVVADANKAGLGHSYGTATADAWRALRTCGVTALEPAQWLRVHHRSAETPGFDHHPDRRWRAGLYFYYSAAYPFADLAMTAHLVDLQARDGSFRNREPLVKEDDPLIATALVLSGMASKGFGAH
jgi:hypothetical protein